MLLSTKEGPGMVTQAYHPSTQSLTQENPVFHASPSHIVTTPTPAKRAWSLTPHPSVCLKGVGGVVWHTPEDLGEASNVLGAGCQAVVSRLFRARLLWQCHRLLCVVLPCFCFQR